MKKLITIFCLFLAMILIQNESFAQQNQSVTFRTLWNNYLNPTPTWDNWEDVFHDANERGVEIAFGRRLNKGTWLMVPLKIGSVRYPKSLSNGIIANLDLLLQNNLCSDKSLLNPNAHLGIGSTWDFNLQKFDLNIPAGVGLNLRLVSNLYLNVQTQYRFSIENRSGWQHGLGLVLNFGEPDRDGDGISDKEDVCPDVPGLKALKGCPDRDGDGISDNADVCPDVAGLANLMGCPDRDGDGIADGDDKCPDLKGPAATLGCPDRDSDGVMDTEDECPDVPGIAAMKGCPDTDNDGITDAKDKCPREAGPAATMGCPDRDGDGINDKDDKCPGDKGPASTMGCPDRDGDGVADKDDACPDKRGDSAHKGCPDTDGDGIYDDTDRCPEKPGVIAMNGCPENKIAIQQVQFETGKAVILKKSYKVLNDVVSMMNENKDYQLKISGHTDNAAEEKVNQDLSERRAKSCYNYFVSKGIAAGRMTSAGFGESKPLSDNKTNAGREQNRRVEFELYVK
jgi:OmpA-OmpF porin, OOP family